MKKHVILLKTTDGTRLLLQQPLNIGKALKVLCYEIKNNFIYSCKVVYSFQNNNYFGGILAGKKGLDQIKEIRG